MELLIEGGLVKEQRLIQLQKEANELTAIFAASRHTARGK